MIVLDTSALLRLLTNDSPAKANQIKDLIEKEDNIFIPHIVFPELEYVLMSNTYNATRNKVLKAFKTLISHKNISTNAYISKAIELYEETKLGMTECIIASAALANRCKLASFDKDLLELFD